MNGSAKSEFQGAFLADVLTGLRLLQQLLPVANSIGDVLWRRRTGRCSLGQRSPGIKNLAKITDECGRHSTELLGGNLVERQTRFGGVSHHFSYYVVSVSKRDTTGHQGFGQISGQ